ncbi:MAG: TCR/Tet family MFS transporter [Pseudomonadota bacterium]
MSDTPAPGPPRKAAIAFIFFTVVLDVLSLGVIIPVLPRLVKDFVGGDTVEAAYIYGLFGTIWAFVHFFASPIVGSLSDRVGRRPVIVSSNVGLGLDHVLMAVAPTLGWLLIGRVISGVMSATISTAYAYIADVVPPDKRARLYGLLGAAFGLGFIVGPIFGGLLSTIDPRLPFWVAAGFNLANALYGFFVLPESLPAHRRTPFSWRRANPIGSLVLLRSEKGLLNLGLVHFFGQLAQYVLQSTFVLYAMYRYEWGEVKVSLTLAVFGLCNVIVQAGLVKPVVDWLGERGALMLGLACGIVGFAILAFADKGAYFLLGAPFTSMWGVAGPALQSLMTRRISPSAQGQLQGALSSIMSVAGMIGPVLFTQVFAYFISASAIVYLPGASFLLSTSILGVASVLAWNATRESSAPLQENDGR